MSRAILGEKKPLTTRPGAALAPADFAAVKNQLQEKYGDVMGEITEELVISSLLYPKVCATATCVYVWSLNLMRYSQRSIFH